jgi:hypothetical protein
MNELRSVISGYSLSEARSAFYYLSRYLKQAANDEYEKDIFDDYSELELGEGARVLTEKMISFIEKKQGKFAKNFTDEEYFEWMNEIDLIEAELDPLPSADQIDQAEKVIKELVIPTLGVNKK